MSRPTQLQEAISGLKKRIIERGDLPLHSVATQIELVDELSQFLLGQYLLEHRKFDAYWTDYVMMNAGKPSMHGFLEDFILNRSPFVKAWKEVFHLFQDLTQSRLRENVTIASIPCGSMRDLLSLDYKGIKKFSLIGIDIDRDTLEFASSLTQRFPFKEKVKLIQGDAWDLPEAQFDLIGSCGLDIYVENRDKRLELYREFWKALRPGGELILGFLTHPPGGNQPSEWIKDKINQDDALLEKVLFHHILNLSCHNFRTSEQMKDELTIAGFRDIRFVYDSQKIFPAVICYKSFDSSKASFFT